MPKKARKTRKISYKKPHKRHKKAPIHKGKKMTLKTHPKKHVHRKPKAAPKRHVHRKAAPRKTVQQKPQIVDRRRQQTPSIQNRDFLLDIKKEIAEAFSSASGLHAQDIIPLIEKPPQGIEADFAIPCFVLAKKLRKAPQQIAQEVAGKVSPSLLVREARQMGPYVNFMIDWKEVARQAIPHILSDPGYGSSHVGKGKTVLVDFSSPNVAKPMGVGHLRSTVIGDSLCRIHRTLGYKVMGDNHLGDWGTQFGKIIVAYKKWGHPEKLEESPVQELLRLYVKFHEDVEIDPKLEEEARKAFKKLEDGDAESLELWKKFTELSMKDFSRTYKSLGVKFDLTLGESFYNRLAKEVTEEALKKGVAKWSQNALVIETGHENPLLIKKSDEATLYATRDLAAIRYRMQKFSPDRILYVVGSEQKSYLEQVFQAAEKLGYISPGQKEKLVHVSFGMISLPEGKMSTRAGRVVLLDHVIEEVTKLAEKVIEAKNPSLPNREAVAHQVGIGAIKYADLSRDRIKDIKFDWDEMLSFEGDTGPYIQYTHARACSILRKGKVKATPKLDASLLTDPKEKELVRKLCEFPETVQKAGHDCKPHYVASYTFDLATLFNEFYQAVPVLKSEGGLRLARLGLVMVVKESLKKGLYLLGIEAPEEM